MYLMQQIFERRKIAICKGDDKMDLTNVIGAFREELPVFKEMTEKFYQKEITAKEYKGISGKYGSYAQRGGTASMLRLRLTGGRIGKEQLKFIGDIIDRYQIDRIHMTTCQTLQLHNLNHQAVFEIVEEALDYGIITWGGGGDFPRNVMASPLSGVEQGEYFDVMPYAEMTAAYLLTLLKNVRMPRKLKVGFSNSPANHTHATFRDLGFAATEDGKFDVYSAGGLGPHPEMGLCVGRGVEPGELLYYVKAMIELFIEHGNYENRAKARTRYMPQILGKEGYVSAFQEKLEQVVASGEQLDIKPGTEDLQKKGDGTRAEGRRIMPQKQDGLYAVSYHPIGGSLDPSVMKALYETIRDMEAVELRLSPDEGMYIINCTGKEAEKVKEVTSGGAETLFESSVACIGAGICQIGIRDSQGLLKVLVEEGRKRGFADGVLPQIHISGCPSSCGTHQIGRIGFHGGVKLVDKVPKPAFTISVNGCQVERHERFGEKLGVILEEDIPACLMEIGEEVSRSQLLFEEWFARNEEKLKAVVGKYLQ